ncbi:hypothetical protein CTI12_AA551560 [Artemisia annua]|uniref:Uncharacterized protein n=1 Tax=Artemisia annua TaxID=35608 RepID=A0A2U1KY62_ARTAN|nr:hypothetical protein CTI12_AA551560 [Artemisia annua]
MSGKAPSFSATVRPGSSSTSSNVNTRNNKPVSMQYKLSDGPPNISDADRRAKDSNVDVDPTKEAGTPADEKPASLGTLGRGDST